MGELNGGWMWCEREMPVLLVVALSGELSGAWPSARKNKVWRKKAKGGRERVVHGDGGRAEKV